MNLFGHAKREFLQSFADVPPLHSKPHFSAARSAALPRRAGVALRLVSAWTADVRLWPRPSVVGESRTRCGAAAAKEPSKSSMQGKLSGRSVTHSSRNPAPVGKSSNG